MAWTTKNPNIGRACVLPNPLNGETFYAGQRGRIIGYQPASGNLLPRVKVLYGYDGVASVPLCALTGVR